MDDDFLFPKFTWKKSKTIGPQVSLVSYEKIVLNFKFLHGNDGC
jgi:hypothetical protein